MSATSEPAALPLHRLAHELQAHRLASAELVDDALARIACLDPRLHAFVTVYVDQARAAAASADAAIAKGEALGPLHGIPVALKDLIEIEGEVTTGGSQVWRDRRSTTTATIVRRLVAAGMIVIGKTHTVEFALGGWGTNQHRGTPWNPWDRDIARTPGGSSSGSGVAVAARMVPCAIGTDTGGSVRLPASFCGIVGLKPTIGRISVQGILPLSPTLDTPGPITRSVEDAALLYDILQGPDLLDARTAQRMPDDVLSGLRNGVAGLRLGALAPEERSGVDAEVLAAYDASLEVLRRLGAEIVPLALPYAFDDFVEHWGRIVAPEAYSFLAEIVDDTSLPIDEGVRARVRAGRDVSASTYLRALRERETIKARYAAPLASVDALLTPTTATPALEVAKLEEWMMPSRFTRVVNYLDLCALALPNGFTARGLPTSLQIVCKAFDEALALRIGWAFEQATSWQARTPPDL